METELVPEDPMKKLDEIRRFLNWVAVATAVLFLLLGAGFVYNRSTVADTNNALCALRADRAKSVETSRAFLLENPQGAGGISVKTIQASITNAERTVKALGGLDC